MRREWTSVHLPYLPIGRSDATSAMLEPRLTQCIETGLMVDIQISPRPMHSDACDGSDLRGVGRSRVSAGRRARQGLLVHHLNSSNRPSTHLSHRRQNPVSRHYDYRLILGRLEALMGARGTGDIVALANLLRSGLVRNLGNITTTKLFTHAYGGTKLLIDDYITQVALSIQYVTMWRPDQAQEPAQATMFTPQAKLELLHDTRQAFGRTTLLLQGGSAFGLCHLGVVKALHLQGLLPRIITGTATGAMIAALVGVHPESELLPLLDGGGIDISVFDSRRKDHPDGKESWLRILLRRLNRFLRTGYLFDMELLEECVRKNVGDLTFEEAYARSKRILNITVATGGKDGTPNLLNYLTAPNVVCGFFI